MSEILPQFLLDTKPVCDPAAVVQVPNARFSVLTPRVIRMEYNPEDKFEDRPSQIFWHRLQPVPLYTARRSSRGILITTDELQLRYDFGEGFSHENLSIELVRYKTVWHFGDQDVDNLKGTARTLDGADGPVPLEDGLISKSGWTVIDDSNGLVFDSSSWINARNNGERSIDLYFFGYGKNYSSTLEDFYALSGAPGIPPRWALGNWWSRYWEYRQIELSELMEEFQRKSVPLSVCIVDMDWHLTKTGNQSSGWTGYTWNRELFPDPTGFIKFLHSLGLRTGLNLHPAEGIHPHEEAYMEMAYALGQSPTEGKPVVFDPEYPDFIKPYFEILHHPQEEGGSKGNGGVDFWWMDWQQGNPVRTPGLNLLWWINHLHYLDQGRENRRRHFLFSRWGGLGNHRYPIGFSGDSFISWRTLAFQPYFTATAANVGYGWWSHDIGGHTDGIEDAELFSRWVQFGVFSPILRLHSTKNMFHERRPWGYDESTFVRVRHAMQLRHAFVPYLYSMAWQDRLKARPLIRPMYHFYPQDEQAYYCPGQYSFGSELIVSPFVTKLDGDLRLARQVVWIPQTDWFDFWHSQIYKSGWHALYGKLDDIPVFAKKGAIVPLDSNPSFGFPQPPESLDIHIFPGANNRFELYEDDGESQGYLNGDFCRTVIEHTWQEGEFQRITIHPVQGATHFLPTLRTYRIMLHAITTGESVKVERNGRLVATQVEMDHEMNGLVINGITSGFGTKWDITVHKPSLVENTLRENTYMQILRSMRANPEVLRGLAERRQLIFSDPTILSGYFIALSHNQVRAILETILEIGIDIQSNSGEQQLVIWNNNQKKDATYSISAENTISHDVSLRYLTENGIVPKFRVSKLDKEFEIPWKKLLMPLMVQVDYGTLLKVRYVLNSNDYYPRPQAGLS